MRKRKRKLVYGIGINDADYIVAAKVEGKNVICPYYQRWCNILRHSYSPLFQKKHPSYIGTTVCKEWHTFSSFRNWMEDQEWENRELDKAILFPGNKVYSPDTCLFVTKEGNNIVLGVRVDKGEYPLGVYFDTPKQQFRASMSRNGKQQTIGRFDTPEEAEKAYLEAKVDHYESIIAESSNKLLQLGLERHKQIIVDKLERGV